MKKILTQSALALLLTAAGTISVASAAPRVLYQSGPYHQEVLPNGTVTGPLGPEVNGG